MNQKTVAGIGIYEKGQYRSSKDGKQTLEYDLWDKMIQRCLPGGYQQTRKPSYIGCTVHPDFIRFQDFAVWCNAQIGFGKATFQLDKDVLVPGNKVYGPDTCCFIPMELNKLLQTNVGGKYPVGVSVDSKGRYKAMVSKNNRKIFLGYHDTPEKAGIAYFTEKHRMIMECVDRWNSQLDPRVRPILEKWEPGRK